MSGRDSARSWISSGSSSQVEELGGVAGVADVFPGALAPHGDAGVGEVAVEFAEDVVGAAGGVAAAEWEMRETPSRPWGWSRPAMSMRVGNRSMSETRLVGDGRPAGGRGRRR